MNGTHSSAWEPLLAQVWAFTCPIPVTLEAAATNKQKVRVWREAKAKTGPIEQIIPTHKLLAQEAAQGGRDTKFLTFSAGNE